MKPEIIQAFIEAARTVLAQEMGDPVEAGRIKVQGGLYRGSGLTVVVGMARGLQGLMLVGMDRQTALNYVSLVLGTPIDELGEMALSGIGELGNLIAGAAGVRLASHGLDVVIAPPTLLVGTQAMITTLGMARLVASITTPCGAVDLQIAARVPN